MSSAVQKIERWQVVHEALVHVTQQRGALDADEARWLREAEQLRIWNELGMVSMVDYLERVLGYAPRTAQQRMRVARALGDLPALEDALSSGELPFSAIKELSRVATRSTESAWHTAARGKNLREIEQLVAGRKPGDLPTDAPDDDARLHSLCFDDITASTYALFRQARQHIDRAHGSRVTDEQVVRACAHALLEGPSREPGTDHGRARNQIHFTVCQHCDRAWQDGGGARVRVDASTLTQARCDAVVVPAPVDGKPQRATQTIPPATRRDVFHRDAYVCQTPGCRSSSGLELHHIIARDRGGTHDPSNLTLRCDSCHRAHHEGRLTISGTAPHALTTTRTRLAPATAHQPTPLSRPHHRPTPSTPDRSTPSRFDLAVTRTSAISALTSSGYKRHVAAAAVDEASAHVGADAPLEVLLPEAFRRCPTRTG